MYKIERRPSGYLLTFGGVIEDKEMKRWVDESARALAKETQAFSVVVDMRTLAPLQPQVQQLMVEGQNLYKGKGMTRSAVIVSNAVTAIQFKRLAKESGIYQWERYLDGAQANCQQLAIGWAKDGVDPDL
jgi:hypothetical protein